jgi:hypothetical protein
VGNGINCDSGPLVERQSRLRRVRLLDMHTGPHFNRDSPSESLPIWLVDAPPRSMALPPTIQRIAGSSVGVVHVLVAGETTVDRLPQKTYQTMPTILPVRLSVNIVPAYARSGQGHHQVRGKRAESLIPVIKDKTGEIVAGLWVGPYADFITRDPKALDIDHMLPLNEARRSCGHSWAPDRRQAYANSLDDPNHPIATWRSANRSKDDHIDGPD